MDYEILSKLMRIVFMLLGVMIVWRTFAWLRKDRRETHKRLKELPDAGTIGILTVLQGSSELPEGAIIPVPQEGVLGFVRTCDIVVPVTDVIAQHLDFTFRNGKGLYIYPRRGCPAAVDGVTLDSPADSRRYPMQHGSVLCVGEAVLQLGVFAGLDVKHYGGDTEPQELPPQETPQEPEASPPPCPPHTDPYLPYYMQPPYPQTIPTEGRPGDEA
ncbi:MAG: hypothetical protein IJ343_15395 [Clostridia bacterium]|nr:hypothetical protein [Clostridia bacterium]